MTVYVDNAFIPATVGRTRARWCHLTADTKEELHTFASLIGLRQSWFQDKGIHWHYDVTETKRALALQRGAKEITIHEMGDLMRARRAATNSTKENTNA